MTIPDTDIKIRMLQAAKSLFAKQGFEGTSVRQICEAASANVALVSYYFGGKENMFGALFENFFPNAPIASIDPDLGPEAGIRLLIHEVIQFRYADPELIRIIQNEIMMNTPRILKIREHVMPIWRLLRSWMETGRAQGVFTFGSLDSTLMSVIGVLLADRHSPYWSVLLDNSNPSLDETVDNITDFIMGALGLKSSNNTE